MNSLKPQMNTDNGGFTRISERIIGCAFTVANTLGPGFVGKVYENALAYELRKAGLAIEQQRGVAVRYDGVIVGEYATDLMVDGVVIVELKAVRQLDDIHRAQCLNYLKATRLRVCLLINFGKPRLEVKRLML
jgi:GxxExxY protein